MSMETSGWPLRVSPLLTTAHPEMRNEKEKRAKREVFDFYQMLNHFYGALTDFCTMSQCPMMTAGPTLCFLWPDANRRPTSMPAPVYIDYAMTAVQKALEDESLFPTKASTSIPIFYFFSCSQ